MDNELFPHEFMQGQRDCRDGIPHKEGESDAYDRGYTAQYQLEQALSEMTR